MKKPVVIIAVSLALAGLAWAGSGFYLGLKAQQALLDLSVKDKAGSPWSLREVQHERGFFSSSGQVTAVYAPACSGQTEQPLELGLSYTIEHLPSPQAPARFSWRLTPQGEAAHAFKTLFGSASALQGQGTLSYAGALRSHLELPAVAVRRNGQTLEMTPTTGQLEVKDQTLRLETSVERMAVRGRGQAMVIEGLALGLDVDELRKGTGSAHFKMGQASTSAGSLEGLELKVQAREQGDRMNMDWTASLRKIEAVGQVLTDLRMQWALHGLHTASVQSMIELVQDSCGLQALTEAESQKAAEALHTLWVKGLSFGMPVLTGKAADGRLEGAFKVELQAAQTPSLARQLRSSGQLEIEGRVISPEQQEMAVMAGFAVRQGSKLSASYEYASGLLKVNHRSLDASAFAAMLEDIDEKWLGALSVMRKR